MFDVIDTFYILTVSDYIKYIAIQIQKELYLSYCVNGNRNRMQSFANKMYLLTVIS